MLEQEMLDKMKVGCTVFFTLVIYPYLFDIQGKESTTGCPQPGAPLLTTSSVLHSATPATPPPLSGPSMPGPSTPRLPINDSSTTSSSLSSSPSDQSDDRSELSCEETSTSTVESILSPPPHSEANTVTYKLVGDNIDKNVKPREMRSNVQTRSLHYFHTYAVRDRVDMSQYSSNSGNVDFGNIHLQEVLPTCRDEVALRDNFAILVGRILAKYMPFFGTLAKNLERHIPHEFSTEMSRKSEVVMLCAFHHFTVLYIVTRRSICFSLFVQVLPVLAGDMVEYQLRLPFMIINIYSYTHTHIFRFLWAFSLRGSKSMKI